MAKEYVVVSGKHHRAQSDGSFKTFKPGDKIVPTEQELKSFPDRFKASDAEDEPGTDASVDAAAQAAALNKQGAQVATKK